MIPALASASPVQSLYLAFMDALKACGFEGELQPDYANRTVLSTDNSIYQVLPQGVVYPGNANDLVRLAELSNLRQFRDIVLCPRGGGTGTNGQSLTDGLVVDISRHMNRILEINVEQRWVRVQAGVVKDQLNAALRPHGLFFAPELSTSNRATIGGMINTDASGQGSCRYGKTRDHVLSLTTVFPDGSEWHSEPLNDEDFRAVASRQDRVGELHRVVNQIHRDHQTLIEATFPPLNRCLTGYDLAHIRTHDDKFDLNSILCGSEGTLGFIAEAKLRVLPIPKYSALVNVRYENFNAALRDARELMKSGPTSIETVDSKVLNLAMNDIVWSSVAEFFPADGEHEIQGINLVEFTADDEQQLRDGIQRLTDQLDQLDTSQERVSLGYKVAWGNAAVQRIWSMRKKAVGLLGNTEGSARPVPFVEDTAVPPENLADYILEFRELLDSHKLTYGMFGHVDAGVLHVRPALDMRDSEQARLVRVISDAVVELTRKYNGLLWGEHGKGVRSEYAPAFFGELYPQLQRIKATCDPRNQLNPGKIATPDKRYSLSKIDAVKTRGEEDRKIPVRIWDAYSEGLYCNGNGACFNWNPHDSMCPSWKATRDRIHSPKGRSALIREWLKQLSRHGVDARSESERVKQVDFLSTLHPRYKNTLAKRRGEYDFSHEVMAAMDGCLACKSCVGQCPINVDVPTFRSKFMELYYSRYLRPLKDYFIGGLELMLPYLARAPWLYNTLMKPRIMRYLVARFIGMVDSPLLTGINLERRLAGMGVEHAVEENIHSLSAEQRAGAVIIVQDAFTSYFETQLVIDVVQLLQKLGFTPLLAPYRANGKPLHVHGFLQAFASTARENSDFLNRLAQQGIPLVGIDPSMTLTYRSEYRQLLGDRAPEVLLLQEWLASRSSELGAQVSNFRPGEFRLLAHCTEKTNAAASIRDWKTVFSALGQSLQVLESGCCGMAGTYGHELQHQDTSRQIYDMSWSELVKHPDNQHRLLATGYSCRSQTQRFEGHSLAHPLQALLGQLI